MFIFCHFFFQTPADINVVMICMLKNSLFVFFTKKFKAVVWFKVGDATKDVSFHTSDDLIIYFCLYFTSLFTSCHMKINK